MNIETIQRPINSLSINWLELSERTVNSLKRIGGIETLGDLVKWKPKDLLNQYGFGKSQLQEVELELKKIGLSLSPNNQIKEQNPEYIKKRIRLTRRKIKQLQITLKNWQSKLKRL